MSESRGRQALRLRLGEWLRPIAAILIAGGFVLAVWAYAILTRPDVLLTRLEFVKDGCTNLDPFTGEPSSRTYGIWNLTFTYANTGGVDAALYVKFTIDSNPAGGTTLLVPHFGQSTITDLFELAGCDTNHTLAIEIASITPG